MRHRICLVVVDKTRGVALVLAKAAPRIGDVDVEIVSDRAPKTDAVKTLLISRARRRHPEAARREIRSLDGNAELETVRLIAEEHVLEAKSSPGAAEVQPPAVLLRFDPDALEVAVVPRPRLLGVVVHRVFAAQVSVVVVAVRLALRFDRPDVVDFHVEAQIHVETVRAAVERIGVGVLVVVVLRAHEAVHLEAFDCLAVLLDVLRVLLDLGAQRGKLRAVLLFQLFEHRPRADVEVRRLHGACGDRRHLVAAHRAVALERAVCIALDDAVLREVVERFVAPMIFGHIAEAVRAVGGERSRAQRGERQGEERRLLLVESHPCPFLSV